MKFLPILIPCTESECDGMVNGAPVRVVSYDVVHMLIWDRSGFRAKYGDIPEDEEKWLRGFWHIIYAFRGGRNQEIKDAAIALAELANAPSPSEILKDPLHFVQEELNQRAGAASVVLWRSRSWAVLNAGIYCEGGMLDALYALMLFSIGAGSIGRVGSMRMRSCIMCGTTFDDVRGRRNTCSDKCRKRASRARAKTASA